MMKNWHRDWFGKVVFNVKTFYSEEAGDTVDERIAAVLEQYIIEQKPVLKAIYAAMQAELIKADLSEKARLLPEPEKAHYELRFDSYDKMTSLYGEWQDRDGYKCGSLLIHQGGQVFAEWDVVCAHPHDKRWFVEAVTVWGKAGALGSELSLLAAV